MMKFAKGTDKVLTIIYTVFSVLLIATFILLLIYAGGLMNNAGGAVLLKLAAIHLMITQQDIDLWDIYFMVDFLSQHLFSYI